MFAIQVEAAIGATKSLALLDGFSRDVWKAWAAGMVGDDDAQRLASLIEGRKAETRSIDTVRNRMPGVPLRLGASFFPPKRRPQCATRTANVSAQKLHGTSSRTVRFANSYRWVVRLGHFEERWRAKCSRSPQTIVTQREIFGGPGVVSHRRELRFHYRHAGDARTGD